MRLVTAPLSPLLGSPALAVPNRPVHKDSTVSCLSLSVCFLLLVWEESSQAVLLGYPPGVRNLAPAPHAQLPRSLNLPVCPSVRLSGLSLHNKLTVAVWHIWATDKLRLEGRSFLCAAGSWARLGLSRASQRPSWDCFPTSHVHLLVSHRPALPLGSCFVFATRMALGSCCLWAGHTLPICIPAVSPAPLIPLTASADVSKASLVQNTFGRRGEVYGKKKEVKKREGKRNKKPTADTEQTQALSKVACFKKQKQRQKKPQKAEMIAQP